MRKLVLATILLPLVSCGPQTESSVPAPAAEPRWSHSSAEPQPVPDFQLAGEYRVAGVDGADIDQPYAITASITQDRIHLTADCLNFAWRYTTKGDRIATTRVAVEACGRGLSAAEEAVIAAIDAAQEVSRSPANAVELRGDGRVVTLFTQ